MPALTICFHNLIGDSFESLTESVVGSDEYQEVCRRNVSQMVHRCIQELPREKTDEGVMGVLDHISDRKVVLPRGKPCPVAKATSTTWEKFAKAKGIEKKGKRSAFVFDDIEKNYKLRFGGRSLRKAEKQRDFIIEHKGGRKVYGDPFIERAQAKALDKAKQKYRTLQNKVKTAGYKLKRK
ncbi:ribosome biogenesis regulatory protein [Gregarina niphandrodes]|uniref:Ribosome biogenesis regulatory protein n=1 Tax=Gregarina niphandrodes TaxID=110365 RepID=A0A023B5P2_GRENI|nr:ribosome biogenesis regulatory protein [Gregarina niphandrodes]EZG61394.1 ribosome biogenesis regulatory protein [Gregarina niphandrodes]|eukprot:XP_011130754.1 ribosome biogenesis regulatory protein [Gregarina niphandrodes]